MKLSPRILAQKAMLQDALQKLNDLDVIDRLFDFDPTYKKVAEEKTIEDYADIMSALRNDLNSIVKKISHELQR